MNRYSQFRNQLWPDPENIIKNNSVRGKKDGFTIIEAVIVLGIASLIFALVFLIIPQLQRAQRDNTRIQEVARLQTAIAEWRADNRNRLPDYNNDAEMQELIDVYLGGNFADPIGGDFSFTTTWHRTSYRATNHPDVNSAVIGYLRGFICNANGDNWTSDGANIRDYAIVYRLEQGPDSGGDGGIGHRQCVDSR